MKLFMLKPYNPPLPWVALLGLDGSGKSSVLKELAEAFPPPGFAGVQIIYRRPNLWGQTQQTDGSAIDHYGKPPHGFIKSTLKLFIRALDWWLGYWGYLAPRRGQKYLVLLDRHYFLDLSVDPLRYRYNGPLWLAYKLGCLLPRPDLFILLDAPIEILQCRKQEVTLEQAAQQRDAYLKLIQSLPYGYIVDASAPLDQVVANVKQIILEHISQDGRTAESVVAS